ncbi:MAG: hypothetical protein ABUK01_01775 [Leptospirales bacterium]
MQNILYFRKEISGATLLVGGLGEDGNLRKYKFPGILKSKKRSSLFLVPGTIWDFTVTGNLQEFIIPKEFNLQLAPFDAEAAYQELLPLGFLMKPLASLKASHLNQPLFMELRKILSKWQGLNEFKKDYVLNRFYLRFLDIMGLLHYSENCVDCNNTVHRQTPYLLNEGSLCQLCIKKVSTYRELTLPGEWVNTYYRSYQDNYKKDTESKLYRENILKFVNLNI